MKRYFFMILMLVVFHRAMGQGLTKYAGRKWEFGFLMIPGDKNSVTSSYYATFFELKSDTTFTMGMSEAMESGKINPDSTMTLRLFERNPNAKDRARAESFALYYCSKDYVVLVQSGVRYDDFMEGHKGFGDMYYVYSQQEINNKKEAEQLFEQLRKAKIID